MSVSSVSSRPSVAATTQSSSTEDFDPASYLQDQLANGTSAQLVQSFGDSYSKNFESKVKSAVDALGPNATQEQVDKAISKETSNQMTAKFIVDRAMNNVMSRIKDMNADTYEG
jgi:hypothetical protein